MSRPTVLGEFEPRFTVARMARNYVAPYRSLLAHLVENRIRGGPEAAHACRMEDPALQAAGVSHSNALICGELFDENMIHIR